MNEQHTVTYDPNWQEKYRSMIASPKEAVSRIMPGHRVFIGTGCAQPQELVRALTSRSSELADTEIVHLLTFGFEWIKLFVWGIKSKNIRLRQ